MYVPAPLNNSQYIIVIQDREKDGRRTPPGSMWASLMSALSLLAMAEKTYTSLTFLGQKWFGRRDVSDFKGELLGYSNFHNLLCVFIYKKTKFIFKLQKLPSNTNISCKSRAVKMSIGKK